MSVSNFIQNDLFLIFLILICVSSFVLNDASLNIHSAVPDGLLKLIDQSLVIGANQVENLQESIPICDSGSGPSCHHIAYSAIFHDENQKPFNFFDSYLAHNLDNPKSNLDDYSPSTIHRYPINLNKQYKYSENIRHFKTSWFEPSYSKLSQNFNENEINDIGLFNTSLPFSSRRNRGIPLHSEEQSYIPEGLLLEDGLGDIYTNENLVQNILQSLEYITQRDKNIQLNQLWYFDNNLYPSNNSLLSKSTYNNTNDKKCKNIANKYLHPTKEKFQSLTDTLGWRGISYLLDFSSNLYISLTSHVPNHYQGSLPNSIQPKWIGLWKVRNFPSIKIWKPYQKEKLNQIFYDTQRKNPNILPYLRALALSTNNSEQYESPNFDFFATLNSPTGQIEFFSSIVVSSMWITFETSQIAKHKREITNTKGLRILGMKSGVIRWIVDISDDLIDILRPNPNSFNQSKTFIYDVMQLAKFSPHHRIDSIHFHYIFRRSDTLIKKLDLPFALGGIVLNLPKEAVIYESVDNNICSSSTIDFENIIENNKNFQKNDTINNEQDYSDDNIDEDSTEGLFFPIIPHPHLIHDSVSGSYFFSVPRNIREDDLFDLLKKDSNFFINDKNFNDSSVDFLIEAEKLDKAPLIPRIHLRSYDFPVANPMPQSDEFSILKDQRSNLINLSHSNRRIRKFQSLNGIDLRSPLKRIGILFQNIPIESPVFSIHNLIDSNLIFHMKPTSKTSSVFLNLENENNYLFFKLRATQEAEDFIKEGEAFMSKLFNNYSNISSIFKDIQSFHIIRKGKIETVKRVGVENGNKIDKESEILPHQHDHHNHQHDHHNHQRDHNHKHDHHNHQHGHNKHDHHNHQHDHHHQHEANKNQNKSNKNLLQENKNSNQKKIKTNDEVHSQKYSDSSSSIDTKKITDDHTNKQKYDNKEEKESTKLDHTIYKSNDNKKNVNINQKRNDNFHSEYIEYSSEYDNINTQSLDTISNKKQINNKPENVFKTYNSNTQTETEITSTIDDISLNKDSKYNLQSNKKSQDTKSNYSNKKELLNFEDNIDHKDPSNSKINSIENSQQNKNIDTNSKSTISTDSPKLTDTLEELQSLSQETLQETLLLLQKHFDAPNIQQIDSLFYEDAPSHLDSSQEIGDWKINQFIHDQDLRTSEDYIDSKSNENEEEIIDI